jgi:hypothetical protein
MLSRRLEVADPARKVGFGLVVGSVTLGRATEVKPVHGQWRQEDFFTPPRTLIRGTSWFVNSFILALLATNQSPSTWCLLWAGS